MNNERPGRSRPQTPRISEGVSVLVCTNRPAYIANILGNYSHQEHQSRELILILNNNAIKPEAVADQTRNLEAVKVFQLDEQVSLGACYNYGVQQCRYSYVAKFDDDDYYAPGHLTDAMRAFRYCDADIIGRHARFVFFEKEALLSVYEGEEYNYVDYVVGATMVFKKSVWNTVRFRDITVGEDSHFQTDALRHGFRVFSIDKYNYVTIRRQDPASHTFKIDNSRYMAYCSPVAHTTDFLPLIVRPW